MFLNKDVCRCLRSTYYVLSTYCAPDPAWVGEVQCLPGPFLFKGVGSDVWPLGREDGAGTFCPDRRKGWTERSSLRWF